MVGGVITLTFRLPKILIGIIWMINWSLSSKSISIINTGIMMLSWDCISIP